MLQQPDIASHQRWRRKAKHLPERKIPRHHSEHRPERVKAYVTLLRVRLNNLISEVMRRVFGVVATDPRALFRLRNRGLDRLPHLRRHHLSECLFIFFEYFGGMLHPECTFRHRAASITAKRISGEL